MDEEAMQQNEEYASKLLNNIFQQSRANQMADNYLSINNQQSEFAFSLHEITKRIAEKGNKADQKVLKQILHQMDFSKYTDENQLELSNEAFRRTQFYLKLSMLAKRAKVFSHFYLDRQPKYLQQPVCKKRKAGKAGQAGGPAYTRHKTLTDTQRQHFYDNLKNAMQKPVQFDKKDKDLLKETISSNMSYPSSMEPPPQQDDKKRLFSPIAVKKVREGINRAQERFQLKQEERLRYIKSKSPKKSTLPAIQPDQVAKSMVLQLRVNSNSRERLNTEQNFQRTSLRFYKYFKNQNEKNVNLNMSMSFGQSSNTTLLSSWCQRPQHPILIENNSSAQALKTFENDGILTHRRRLDTQPRR